MLDIGPAGIWTSSRLWKGEGEADAEAAAELDELGYSALWLGGSSGDLRLPEAVLGATRHLIVATGIVDVWTNPAETVAASYQRVTAVHPDRLLLGLGSGHAVFVEAQTGQRYTRPVERLGRYLDELDAAEHVVPSDRRVLAALGPRALELAAHRTAGAHPYLVTPEHTRRAREIVGPDAFLAPEQKVVLETDPATARSIAQRTVSFYLELPNYTNNLRRLGFGADLDGGGSARLVDALVAWGDIDTVVARIAEHIEAGADHVCVQVLSADQNRPQTLPRQEWRTLAAPLSSLSPGPRPVA